MNPKIGDIVLVRLDDGTEREFRVKYEPWALGHGKMVLGLRGISGGYALDRVIRIVKPETVGTIWGDVELGGES